MKDISSNHSVVTDEVVTQQIESIAVDEYGRVDEISLDYNEYRNELVSIYKKTVMENSIISTYSIVDDFCNHTLIIRNSSGIEEMKKIRIFNYNDSFIESFLIPMVEDYNHSNAIFDSVIEVLDGDKANFVIRTTSNDSLILIGITIELANKLKELVSKKDISVGVLNKKSMDDKGVTNHLVIILTIVAIGMVLVGTVIFSIAYYK